MHPAHLCRSWLFVDVEAAQARGEARVMVDGSMIEVPIYHDMRRLLARADELAGAEG